jgi:hypothetical protein
MRRRLGAAEDRGGDAPEAAPVLAVDRLDQLERALLRRSHRVRHLRDYDLHARSDARRRGFLHPDATAVGQVLPPQRARTFFRASIEELKK